MRGGGFLQIQAVMVARAGGGACRPEVGSGARPASDGAHVFTGGLGGLGLLTARVLIKERDAKQLLLSSRSGQVQRGSEADWAWLTECGAAVRCVRNDASDPMEIRQLVHSLHAESWRLGGVFHAAGVLADAVLAFQTAATLQRKPDPKPDRVS